MSEQLESPPFTALSSRDDSPKIDKVKNFSAQLKSRAKIEAAKEGLSLDRSSRPGSITARSGSSSSTARPDSVLSFRSEMPNVKQSDFGSFRPESASALPPDTVTTYRPDSVAAAGAMGQSSFRPFQPPSGPTARLSVQYPSQDADWEAKDEMRQRELEEMRGRAAQMEKTMRWWSDCTANWREKWSKVRNERNKIREDCRQLRSKFEVVVKECTGLKREKQELVGEVEKLKAELELLSVKDPDKDSDSLSSCSSMRSQQELESRLQADFCDPSDNVKKSPSSTLTSNMAEAKLKELTKILIAEKEDKESLKTKMYDLHSELTHALSQLDDAYKNNKILQDELQAVRTSNSMRELTFNEGHMDELRVDAEGDRSKFNQEDDKAKQQLEALRQELEKMQLENASEWARREQLESERHALERENKKLLAVIEDLQQDVRKKSSSNTGAKQSEFKLMSDELESKTKDLFDLRQQCSKHKKASQETSTELQHEKRRSEQYEMEVRKLRTRIEDLKDDLMAAQNEVDIQTNLVRKLQRNCEELTESNENYRAQNEHLMSRLKSIPAHDVMNFNPQTRQTESEELYLDDEESDG